MLPRSSRSRSARNGFTLIEMIVVIAIIGIVLAIVIPYFGQIAHRARVSSEARNVSTALLRARLEAIKRGTNVSVEISTNPGKVSYRNPVVYVDNGSTTGSYDTSDTLLSQVGIASGAEKDTFLIDNADASPPSTASQTIEYVFTPFGSMDPASSTKSIYVGDASGNLIQIAIPVRTTGKIVSTKHTTGTNYVSRPWTWT